MKYFNSGIANSVDPDQTAVSDLGLHCLHMSVCKKFAFGL